MCVCLCVRWWGLVTRGWRVPGTVLAWRCSGRSPPGSAWLTVGGATSTCPVRSSCQRQNTHMWCCSVPGCWWTSTECQWPKQVRSPAVCVTDLLLCNMQGCLCVYLFSFEYLWTSKHNRFCLPFKKLPLWDKQMKSTTAESLWCHTASEYMCLH